MTIDTGPYRANEGHAIDLLAWPTRVEPPYSSKSEYETILASHVGLLSDQQQMLYASNSHAVLLIFQAMDAAGKDGVIRHVMSGINPQGCQVVSYKQPSATELRHDFLWRTTRDLPERGRIGIFNRSYYEDVLIARVHPEILLTQGVPKEALSGAGIWESRYRSILGFEQHLHENRTRVVKFFLHLSKEEQRKRFLARIDEPEKNWKFDGGDIQERQHWDDYMDAYAGCIGATTTGHAPWYIVPADDKRTARLIVSQVILNTLKDLKLSYPAVTAERRQELLVLREKLAR